MLFAASNMQVAEDQQEKQSAIFYRIETQALQNNTL